MFFKKQDQIKPLPYPIYCSCVVLITLIGLAISIYLSFSHYRVYTDIGYKSFCAISKAINCDTVSQSPYAIFAGVPLPVWGCLVYTIFIFLTIVQVWTGSRTRLWPLLFLAALLFSLHSIVLALISTVFIKSYCLMCILDYAVNFGLLFMVWIIRKRFDSESLFEGVLKDWSFISARKSALCTGLTIVLGVTLSLVVFFPAYWTYSMPSLNETTKTGVTKEGFPWIGSEDPRIVIEEFTDYKCFQCKKMHFFLRQLIDQYPDKIQLVHRHFPMDHIVNPLVKEPFHEGSGALALLSIYAKKENRFWDFNDMLFEKVAGETQFETKEMAETFGFDPRAFTMSLNSRESRITLNRDIIDGIKLGITGTPAYLIDGHVYQGYIPPEAIKKIME
jgi:protein-disulfide isomerase/uncharacterized membrane protein